MPRGEKDAENISGSVGKRACRVFNNSVTDRAFFFFFQTLSSQKLNKPGLSHQATVLEKEGRVLTPTGEKETPN